MEERLIRVKVVTDARQDTISENKKGEFLISVREPAAQNRANTRACQLIAMHLDVPVKLVQIVAGHHHSRKTFRVVTA